MKRVKRHRIKHEMPESSSTVPRREEEHDLAYYIHDRVELMHQVFSVLKSKDLRAMAPECVRRLSIDDLEELCTEELLGISSKRLLAILDGAEPPSDTESSSQSPERYETISLDSISSGEELLAVDIGKKKHKHKHQNSKKKHKKKKSAEPEDPERSRASRAGLTVLELLELQARARAIRAQLQNEQANKQTTEAAPESSHQSQSTDSEVEIKEEPAEVVEISSEDEKPNLQDLEKALPSPKKTTDKTTNKTSDTNNKESKSNKKKEKSRKKDKERRKDSSDNAKDVERSNKDIEVADNSKTISTETQKITKRGDLIITVPQQSTRKIKLNRHNVTVSVQNVTQVNAPIIEEERSIPIASVATKVAQKPPKSPTKITSVVTVPAKEIQPKPAENKVKKDKSKKKHKKKEIRTSIDDDDDGITLQLSDSEKMDLLENFDRKDYDKVSSSSSDSDSSSTDSDDTQDTTNTSKDVAQDEAQAVIKIDDSSQDNQMNETDKIGNEIDKNEVNEKSNENDIEMNEVRNEIVSEVHNIDESLAAKGDVTLPESERTENDVKSNAEISSTEKIVGYVSDQCENGIEITNINDIPIQNDIRESQDECQNRTESKSPEVINNTAETDTIEEGEVHCTESEETNVEDEHKTSKEVSEGEITEESSEVEAVVLKPEVVCISDDDAPKKKKKKDKKAKKEKKKKLDFRESADQNFYKENTENAQHIENIRLSADDDVQEILELSDDSSCYEVEGTVLSKEPTVDEIAALSAKIDEIEREEQAREQQKLIEEDKQKESETEKDNLEENSNENAENISWKDRYLGSKKVKKVLTTSNILNALRNKNKQLKKKMEESKKREKEIEQQKEEAEKRELLAKRDVVVEEGSIEHFNTLEGSTKYVDPVADPKEIEKEAEKTGEGTNEEEDKSTEVLTGEMKKDAKQLLKMYKKLLKYNDMTKQKDPNKKKSKKKKNKDKKGVASATVVNNS